MNDGEPMAHLERLEGLSPGLREVLREKARVMQVPRGTVVFTPGRRPESMLLVLEGRVRVYQVSEAGREIVLYRVEAGESCVLTTACMLAEEAYNAEGIAETDLTVITLPRADFDRLTAEEPCFRDFVFAAYSRRLIDLLRVVNDVAFARMDMRLAERLLLLAGEDDSLAATHSQLASELGTAREVISRLLHDFQKRGFVAQSRGRIDIADRAALRAMAQAG